MNRLTAAYGDIPLAAVGIVLKLERIPLNTGLGIYLARFYQSKLYCIFLPRAINMVSGFSIQLTQHKK